MLSIADAEAGTGRAEMGPVDLEGLADDVAELYEPAAEEKGLRLERALAGPAEVAGNRQLLFQALANLLDNAIKYTPEGGTVCVQTDVNEQKKRVFARITDTGVGIPPKDLPFVFDKFYRAEANNRMAKGTGLGLSLVKHIVETVHQGRIFVESQVGKGSCFGFELDLCE